MGEGGAGSEEGFERRCKPGWPSHCPSISPSAQHWTHPGQSQLFADLSQEELTAVMSFLTQQLGPGLVDAAQARPSDNCIFSVELQLPPKAAALAHLDRGSPPPAREALAIVFFGGQPQPNVSELVVGPLPHPSYMRDVTVERHGGPLPYHRRPVLIREYLDIDQMIFDRDLPQAAAAGRPQGSDPARWTIQKVFFQGRYYQSLAQLEDQFEAGLVNVVLTRTAFSGPRIFDIRFQGERVAYEVSVQEALTVYGGNSPSALRSRYTDGGFGLGHFSSPLTQTVLVVRSVSTMLNYDYVWDMVFHPNGAMEVKLHATGYISSTFLFGAARSYGNQAVSTSGQKNWVWAEDMVFVPMAVPWSPEHQMQRLQVTRKQLETEEQATFPLGSATPRYLYLASNHSNKWGHPRGYRIQVLSFAGEPLPQNSSMERDLQLGEIKGVYLGCRFDPQPWYQLAVTQRKEEEPSSTSIYNLNDPWTPTVDFTDFINNETVAGQDLVAWVTAGFLHIPHAEDIPNTVTVGNGVGFFLRPYNFFDQDPSFDSADSIYFRGDQDAGACEVNPLACLPKAADCAPDLPAFSHGGFSHN
ncbi:hypothetical protein QTO34_009103 [Cnephaeus nilssonii]|uniref:Amine oxidase n=1 Tax=Cnephaeus nilssonii TaxID=3371016 RepID=A0AA40LGN1_CNENI|nr:hypothetical protein QTO34_009103 [Eptesicus nilssonii]